MIVSAVSIPSTASICARLATTLACVSITPFGRPVVPLE